MANHFPAARTYRMLLIAAAVVLPSASAAEIRFAAFGDIGNTPNSAAVAKLTRAQNAAFDLLLGDLCYGSQSLATQINANYSVEYSRHQLWPALGNHEFEDSCGGGGAQNYLTYFTLPGNERYYDFKRWPIHFFVLNSNKDPDGVSATSKQAMWLKAKLAASTSPWKIVYFHHPPYSSGQHGSSTFMRWPFEAWGVDAVLSGHDHDYERVMKDANGDGVTMPYFVSGLGGIQRRSFGTTVSGSVKRYNSGFGALFVTASSTSLTFEFRNTNGTLIDRLARTKAKPTTSALKFREVPE